MGMITGCSVTKHSGSVNYGRLVGLLIRLPAITAQPPAEVLGFPDVDAIPVVKSHLDQVDTRLVRSGREAGRGAGPCNKAQLAPD
jgi:hypothetical protein